MLSGDDRDRTGNLLVANQCSPKRANSAWLGKWSRRVRVQDTRAVDPVTRPLPARWQTLDDIMNRL